MVADTTRGSLGYTRLLRLASDGDAAAAEEESAFAPVVPTYEVVDSFAGPQHLKDLSLTRSLPNPPRLENHPISDLALNHRRTSLKCRLSSRAWYLSLWTQSEGNDRQRAGRIGQVAPLYRAQVAPPKPLVGETPHLEWRPSLRNGRRVHSLSGWRVKWGSNLMLRVIPMHFEQFSFGSMQIDGRVYDF